MGRHSDGDQQPVTGRASSGRFRALVGLCVLVGVGASLWGMAHARPAGHGEPGAVEVDVATGADGVRGHVDGEDEVRTCAREPNSPSSPPFYPSSGVTCETFMQALSDRSRARDGNASVRWDEPSGLPATTRDILETYRDSGVAELLTSGYLDISGRIWGGVIGGEGAWVDVLFVQTDDDTSSEVRITRMWADEER